MGGRRLFEYNGLVTCEQGWSEEASLRNTEEELQLWTHRSLMDREGVTRAEWAKSGDQSGEEDDSQVL